MSEVDPGSVNPAQGQPVITTSEDDPAIATDGDDILKDGGRTDNAAEVDGVREPQDPNAVIESDPSRVVADG